MAKNVKAEEEDRPEFPKAMAWKIYGKRILVGLSCLDSMGNVTEQRQFHGEVIRASPQEGIVLRLGDGAEYALPPDFRSVKEAKTGEYRLHSTGEIVVDPDFLATYTVTRR